MKRILMGAILCAALSSQAMAMDEHEERAEPAGVAAASASMIGTGLFVEDLDRSVRFYRDGLGMTVAGRIPLGDKAEVILSFGKGGQPFLFLVGTAKPDAAPADPRPDPWTGRLVVAATDLEAMRAKLSSAGYEPGEIKVHTDSGTSLFWATDPDGHRIEIIRPAAPLGAEQQSEANNG